MIKYQGRLYISKNTQTRLIAKAVNTHSSKGARLLIYTKYYLIIENIPIYALRIKFINIGNPRIILIVGGKVYEKVYRNSQHNIYIIARYEYFSTC